jgi:excisionase family DNA binding protein
MTSEPMPPLRHSVAEAAQMLRISPAHVYKKISEGVLRAQRDGSRSYISNEELRRYVAALEPTSPPVVPLPKRRGRRPRGEVAA